MIFPEYQFLGILGSAENSPLAGISAYQHGPWLLPEQFFAGMPEPSHLPEMQKKKKKMTMMTTTINQKIILAESINLPSRRQALDSLSCRQE